LSERRVFEKDGKERKSEVLGIEKKGQEKLVEGERESTEKEKGKVRE